MITEAKIVKNYKKSWKKFADKKFLPTFALAITKSVVDGAIAQLVEQRTENPCVPGSNPGGTTKKSLLNAVRQRFRRLFSCFGPDFGNILLPILRFRCLKHHSARLFLHLTSIAMP